MLDRNILLTVGQWKCLRRHINVVHPAEESTTKVGESSNAIGFVYNSPDSR